MSIIGVSSGKPAIQVSRAVASAKRPVRHDADVGAGAADVEGDEVRFRSDERAGPGAAQHAGGGAGQHRHDRAFRDHRWRRDAAIRGHDVEVAVEPRLADAPVEPRDVVAHLRPDEGVHRRRREALELAELRGDVGRDGDERIRVLLEHDLAGAPLMRRVEVGEEEADRDRGDAASRSARAASRTSSSSSGTSTSPLGGTRRSVTTWRCRRLTKGVACQGICCRIE